MLSSTKNLKELPQVGVTSLHRSVGSAAPMRGDIFYMEEKGCVLCGEIKSATLFYPRSSICKSCRSDEDKEIRRLNPIKTKLINPLKDEEWKDVQGFEGLYRVSSLGRVTSLCKSILGKPRPRRAEKLLKPFYNKVTGYWGHVFSHFGNGKDESARVHVLVARHFIPNPLNLPEVNHLNGKHDNRAISLEWATRSDNIRHAFRTGLITTLKGDSHPKAKLTTEQVLFIFNSPKGSRELSRELSIPHTNIMNIRHGYSWNSITGLPHKIKRKSW
jgi:hypothetical protein